MNPEHNYRKLDAYRMAFQLGLDILQISAHMPNEAMNTVAKGMMNASQMVSVKIAEGWARRTRPGALETHLHDAETALAELQLWLMVSLEYKYINGQAYTGLKPILETLASEMHKLHRGRVVYN